MATIATERMPVLRFRPQELPNSVIVVGDQDRADQIAESLDGAEEIGRYREYVTYRGSHNGVPVAVASHGVGAAGAAVCFEELCRAGARTIIRVGTAGGLQDDVLDGHVVIATGAVRDDGVTDRLVPLSYPAVPSYEIVRSLSAQAGGVDVTTHEGVVLTSALFHPHDILGNSWDLWQRAGVVAIEMECAALFVIASVYGIDAGAVLAIDGNPLVEGDTGGTGYDPHRQVVQDAVEGAATIALESLAALEEAGGHR